jgi:hypothetical protein
MASNTRPKGKFLLILIVLLIQSCGGSSPPVDLPVTQAETGSVMPAATAAPSRTPKPIPAGTATPDFIATKSVKALVDTIQPLILETYLLPDGVWKVEFVRYGCTDYTDEDYRGTIAYEQVKLLNLGNGSEKIVADQLQACDGIGTYGFGGLYWSPNTRYFYYTDSREGYPGGCGNYIMPAIYRLDTVTQESVLLGGGHLSPDGTKLAMWQGDEIVIWDLDLGEVGRVQNLVPEFFPGEIAWAPDSQSIVYLQTEFDCARDYGISYVIHVDIGKMSQTLLIKYPPPGFGVVDWYSPGQITLQDGDGNYFNYDFFTREKTFLGKTPFTPTPLPPGIFALKFYPPLIMSYDPSVWMDKSRYTDYKFMVNYLQASNLKTCQIGVVGPSGNFPADAKPVWVGKVEYFYSLSEVGTPGMTGALYIENQSLSKFDYTDGLPVLMITASKPEWDRCKVLGEVVLSTLRVP